MTDKLKFEDEIKKLAMAIKDTDYAFAFMLRDPKTGYTLNAVGGHPAEILTGIDHIRDEVMERTDFHPNMSLNDDERSSQRHIKKHKLN